MDINPDNPLGFPEEPCDGTAEHAGHVYNKRNSMFARAELTRFCKGRPPIQLPEHLANATVEQTFWNGEPAKARKVWVVVADNGVFPHYWARALVGQEVEAVEVVYGGETFYLYDEDNSGWFKVTRGKGSPGWGSKSLIVSNVRERN